MIQQPIPENRNTIRYISLGMIVLGILTPIVGFGIFMIGFMVGPRGCPKKATLASMLSSAWGCLAECCRRPVLFSAQWEPKALPTTIQNKPGKL
ncbi:MAG: hypothetical protein FWC56_04360 [Phycisphaerae bacterium]|nr:hypothetical protein [Phycisphaerae bacterium]